MKVKRFTLDRGKFTVVANYVEHNDTTKADDEHTMRTYEKPRPKLYEAFQNLGLEVREFWRLKEHKLRIFRIAFAENKDGHIVTIWLESVDELEPLPVGPLKLKRELDLLAGTNDRDPESKKNPVLDAVDLVENKITEYLNGDREQPKLPEPAQIEARPQGRFAFIKEKIAGGKKAAPAQA